MDADTDAFTCNPRYRGCMVEASVTVIIGRRTCATRGVVNLNLSVTFMFYICW